MKVNKSREAAWNNAVKSSTRPLILQQVRKTWNMAALSQSDEFEHSTHTGSTNNEPCTLFIIKTEASLVISGEMDSLKICIQIELVPYWLKIERRTNVILPAHYGNIEQWISRLHTHTRTMKYEALVICKDWCF